MYNLKFLKYGVETNKVRKIEKVHTTNFFYILRKGIHKVGEFPKKIVMKD